jgi:hypothetical protein
MAAHHGRDRMSGLSFQSHLNAGRVPASWAIIETVADAEYHAASGVAPAARRIRSSNTPVETHCVFVSELPNP